MKQAAHDELRRIIREEEPQKPSTRISELGRSGEPSETDIGATAARLAAPDSSLASIAACRHTEPAKLARLVRGDLDWIVMKALEKDRSRRYETANGFALDAERYLADEPVLACSPSTGYRLRKFARRNKGLLTAAGLVAIALVAGTAVSTWQAFRATRAEGLAQSRLTAETRARTDAETARRDAVSARNDAEAARDRERELRDDADAARAKSDENLRLALDALDRISISAAKEWLPRVSGTGGKDLALVREALGFYETFAQKNEDDPKIRWEVGRAYWRVGWLYRNVGRLTDAEAAYQRAIVILGRLTAEAPDNLKYRDYLSSSYLHLGLVLRDADRHPLAEQAIREAVAIREKQVADFPTEHRIRSSLANALCNLADLLLANRRFGEADESSARSLELLERLHVEFPDNKEYLGILGRSLGGRGSLLAALGRNEEAEQNYLRALGYREQLAAQSSDRDIQFDVVRTCAGLAELMLDSKRFADAERYARQAIAIDQRLTDRYPGVGLYRNALQGDQRRLTAALNGQGKPLDHQAEPPTKTNGAG
jgi:tetratricopeptide (TPR) repeat protein